MPFHPVLVLRLFSVSIFKRSASFDSRTSEHCFSVPHSVGLDICIAICTDLVRLLRVHHCHNTAPLWWLYRVVLVEELSKHVSDVEQHQDTVNSLETQLKYETNFTRG